MVNSHAVTDGPPRAVVRTWDDFNRLTTETADGKTTIWSYDTDGRRTGVAIPDGAALAYAYDGLGRLVTMTDSSRVTEYTLNKNGLPRILTQPDLSSQHWEYRRGGREATAFTVKNSTGVAIRSQTYTYDGDGNRLTETDVSAPRATTLSRVNTYDAAGRLKTTAKTETGVPVETATYGYDLLGNRVGEEIVRAGTTVTTLAAAFDGANQLTDLTGTRESAPYSLTTAYDPAGNLITASDGRSYAYDPAGKMVRDLKDGVTTAHLYNWEGRRTRSVTGAATVEYIHDGRSLLVEYLNGSVSRSYHYGERLTGVEAGALKYGLHLDPLGSVVEVTSDAGSDCARTYDPWGEFNENGPCAADPKLAFTGHEYDQASGLYNFGARYYDPATARFTTLDPYFGDTSTPPSLHKYLYAYANPYRWVDPTGMYMVLTSEQRSHMEERLGKDNLRFVPVQSDLAEFQGTYFVVPGKGAKERWDALGGDPTYMNKMWTVITSGRSVQTMDSANQGWIRAKHVEDDQRRAIIAGANHVAARIITSDSMDWGNFLIKEAFVAAIDAADAIRPAPDDVLRGANLVRIAARSNGSAGERFKMAGAGVVLTAFGVVDIVDLIPDPSDALQKGMREYGERLVERVSDVRRIGKTKADFEGIEIRGLKDLSHVDEGTLKAMAENGFAPRDAAGSRLVLHHLDQNPAGPVVEITAPRHSIGNRVQHPRGNAPGSGLTAEERAGFDAWRVEYWKARARDELARRGLR